MKITHGPLKTRSKKDQTIGTEDIQQFYVSEYYTNMKQNDKPLKSYGLYAILESGEKIQILKDCSKDTALYLEQEAERFLKIKDEAVTGEVLE